MPPGLCAAPAPMHAGPGAPSGRKACNCLRLCGTCSMVPTGLSERDREGQPRTKECRTLDGGFHVSTQLNHSPQALLVAVKVSVCFVCQ